MRVCLLGTVAIASYLAVLPMQREHSRMVARGEATSPVHLLQPPPQAPESAGQHQQATIFAGPPLEAETVRLRAIRAARRNRRR
jgi:hypothetical protein